MTYSEHHDHHLKSSISIHRSDQQAFLVPFLQYSPIILTLMHDIWTFSSLRRRFLPKTILTYHLKRKKRSG